MKVTLIVLDGVGVGALPDASSYGDAGSDTIGHVADVVDGLTLPRFERLGLGNVHAIRGVSRVSEPLASFGRMAETSAGKDSTTGHWELMGLPLDRPFPTYPNGFPGALVDSFEERIGRAVIGNEVASGTDILARLGEEHVRTGRPILYTSADSVFQIAAHEAVVDVAELYRFCRIARDMLTGEHAVGRVIARPFVGESGDYRRTANRRDFSVSPHAPTLLDHLLMASIPVFGVGKVGDLFAHRGFTDVTKTASNDEGVEATLTLMRQIRDGLIFVNLLDFDTAYGHRNDPEGFANALVAFDAALEEIVGRCEGDDMLLITADHGNDPTTPGTDHSREYVPLLCLWPRGRRAVDLGTRRTFSDVAATLADAFHLSARMPGRSFLPEIR